MISDFCRVSICIIQDHESRMNLFLCMFVWVFSSTANKLWLNHPLYHHARLWFYFILLLSAAWRTFPVSRKIDIIYEKKSTNNHTKAEHLSSVKHANSRLTLSRMCTHSNYIFFKLQTFFCWQKHLYSNEFFFRNSLESVNKNRAPEQKRTWIYSFNENQTHRRGKKRTQRGKNYVVHYLVISVFDGIETMCTNVFTLLTAFGLSSTGTWLG